MHPFSPNFAVMPHCWTNCMSTFGLFYFVHPNPTLVDKQFVLKCRTNGMSTRVDIQYVQSLRGQSVWTNLGGHTVRPASLWTKCFKSRWTYSLSRVDNRFVHPQYWGLVLQLCGQIVCPPHFGAWTLQSVDQKIGWT
jgi:hypothetical protein